MSKLKTKSPSVLLGKTVNGLPVLGGAFQLADTYGLPLWAAFIVAREQGFVVSLPHYFASAMEHGWDDEQTFSKIKEALVDFGNPGVFEQIQQGCVAMFMKVALTMPGCSAVEIGKRMRELLENNAASGSVQPQPDKVPTAPVNGVPAP